jgi:integrase/recombinase XerD
MEDKMRLATLIKRFFSHYLPVRKGLATNSILAYRDAVKLLLCYGADTLNKSVEDLTVEEINEPLVLEFLDHLEKERGCTARTRNARLAAVRALFGFIAREEPSLLFHCQAVRTIPFKRTSHKVVAYLEEAEMQALLDGANCSSHKGTRDNALLLLLYNTGARVSEIVQLTTADLRFCGTAHVTLLGKGNKCRSCPLWPETVEALKCYIATRIPKDPTVQKLFLNTNGSPLTRFGVRHIIRSYAGAAKTKCPSLAAKAVNPHTIRHTTAMHLLRSGNDVTMVSYWLGHADINTTHIYMEIDMEMKRQMMQKAGAPAVKQQLPWQKPDVLQWLNALTRGSQLCGASTATG